eukprot:2480058-Amphidinium_carterae.2
MGMSRLYGSTLHPTNGHNPKRSKWWGNTPNPRRHARLDQHEGSRLAATFPHKNAHQGLTVKLIVLFHRWLLQLSTFCSERKLMLCNGLEKLFDRGF